MKTYRIPTALLFVTALVLSSNTLLAVPTNPTLSFHETGRGTVELPNGVVIPLIGALAPDPGPGGLATALTFTTHPAEALFVPGDVLILDSNGKISDVFRFNPGTTTATGFSQGLVFYSNDSGGLLADTGLPTAFQANTVTILENSASLTTYTPIAGQPGFESGIPVPIVYQIFSTRDAGSTLSLLGLAVSGLVLMRRRIITNSSQLTAAP